MAWFNVWCRRLYVINWVAIIRGRTQRVDCQSQTKWTHHHQRSLIMSLVIPIPSFVNHEQILKHSSFNWRIQVYFLKTHLNLYFFNQLFLLFIKDSRDSWTGFNILYWRLAQLNWVLIMARISVIPLLVWVTEKKYHAQLFRGPKMRHPLSARKFSFVFCSS